MQEGMKSGWEGSQEVRWYSGRTAMCAPWRDAFWIWEEAYWKFCSGDRGCDGGLVGSGRCIVGTVGEWKVVVAYLGLELN